MITPKNSVCSFSATGPRRPLPIGMRSMERMGVISAAVPEKKTSSAMYSISRGMSVSITGMPLSRASARMRIARNAGQHRRAQRRSVDLAVAHHENVLAGALADIARGIEGDAFDVAVGDGFHLDQLRVHVIGPGLGHGGQGIGRHAVPTGDAHVHALGQRFLAQVLAPFPTGDVDLDGVPRSR